MNRWLRAGGLVLIAPTQLSDRQRAAVRHLVAEWEARRFPVILDEGWQVRSLVAERLLAAALLIAVVALLVFAIAILAVAAAWWV